MVLRVVSDKKKLLFLQKLAVLCSLDPSHSAVACLSAQDSSLRQMPLVK